MRNSIKFIITVLIIVGVYFLLRHYGATDAIRLENVPEIKTWVASFGAIAPLVYIGLYIAATVFFLPGLPTTVLAGIAFGPVWGVIYAWIASIIAVSVAFLIARYTARSLVESWVAGNEQFKKVDEGVKQQGWRILMFTRLMPIFPYNFQNYAYGITQIRFSTYIMVSAVFMLPGTIAWVQIGASLVSGEGDIWKTMLYLALAGVFILLLSFIPKFLRKRQPDL